MNYRAIAGGCSILLVCACGTKPLVPSATHVQKETPHSGTIPAPVNQVIMPPPPRPTPKAERYSVVVNNVKGAGALVCACARRQDQRRHFAPGIAGNVTLNAIEQTLPQILGRIAKQVDLRYELDGQNLVVLPDTPYLRNYRVDYVNMARDASSSVAIATQIATTGAAATGRLAARVEHRRITPPPA